MLSFEVHSHLLGRIRPGGVDEAATPAVIFARVAVPLVVPVGSPGVHRVWAQCGRKGLAGPGPLSGCLDDPFHFAAIDPEFAGNGSLAISRVITRSHHLLQWWCSE